ncbi:aerotolerance-like protein [Bacteroidales bacterium]|nr:aerotolerance-like protein [Bacteroidales bacterium]
MVLIHFGGTLLAQDVSFKGSAPSAVAVGQQFRLSYSINSDAKDLRVPELSDFEVLMGPSVSSSKSMSYSAGQTRTVISNTYTYILMGKSEGTFTIPAASIKVGNSEYKSNPLTVKVLPQDKSGAAAQGGAQEQGGDVSSETKAASDEDVFVRMHISKNSVYENEGFLVTFKLYSLYDVTALENLKFPDFDGFIAQEIDLLQERQMELDSYNGRNYRSFVLKQTVLYPQRSGKISLESGKYDIVIRIRSQQKGRNIFDVFDTYSNVKKSLTTSTTSINVKPLPSGKPASFNGAVGQYSMSSSISTTDTKANESVTVKLVLSGNGNIKLLKNPELNFPNDFEIYDPQVNLSLKTNASGVSGSKTIEYLTIPRHAGDFEIPAVEFSYFDINSGSYKTLKSDAYKLHVAKGTGENTASSAVFSGSSNKEDVKFLGKDIHYVKTKNISFSQKGQFFFGSLTYWLFYIVPLVLFVFFFFYYRKQVKENSNIALLRTKKANKVASKRLKNAGVLLKSGNKEAFYDETLKAVWGYLSDKLNIPLANLTKDNVDVELNNYGVSQELLDKFRYILDNCEFARYAPSSDAHEMDKVFESALDAIDKMENTIKKINIQ